MTTILQSKDYSGKAVLFKRKWKTDNRRFRSKHFRRMGLLSLQDFYPQPA
uniref:Uncharacterized protein n=1 Tax=Candidatus Kentrum sp. SD TaxID=2126332 RepID=A0A451BID9_9GAMM|nr:MAG: hypothetical protein BECKSD772E_GA0070983_104515 [Candidatus Kentron sp. SD]VFK78042.1 MAG: hypothetical protein BECKSD772D_GA0070982_100545 [Candidatus Kentron sp. SD]